MFPCCCLGGQGSFWGTSPRSWCHVKEGEQLKFFPIDSQIQSSYFFSFPFLILLTIWQLDLVVVFQPLWFCDYRKVWLKQCCRLVMCYGKSLVCHTWWQLCIPLLETVWSPHVCSKRSSKRVFLPRLETTEHLVLRARIWRNLEFAEG